MSYVCFMKYYLVKFFAQFLWIVKKGKHFVCSAKLIGVSNISKIRVKQWRIPGVV